MIFLFTIRLGCWVDIFTIKSGWIQRGGLGLSCPGDEGNMRLKNAKEISMNGGLHGHGDTPNGWFTMGNPSINA